MSCHRKTTSYQRQCDAMSSQNNVISTCVVAQQRRINVNAMSCRRKSTSMRCHDIEKQRRINDNAMPCRRKTTSYQCQCEAISTQSNAVSTSMRSHAVVKETTSYRCQYDVIPSQNNVVSTSIQCHAVAKRRCINVNAMLCRRKTTSFQRQFCRRKTTSYQRQCDTMTSH